MANKRFQDLPPAGTLTGSEIIPVEQGGVGVYKVLLSAIKSFISATLLPLTGGTLTGVLNGTSASFSGPVTCSAINSAGGTLTGPLSGTSGAFSGSAKSFSKETVVVQAQSAAQVTAPSDTNDNTLATITIPVLGANDAIRISGLKFSFTGSVNLKTLNIKLNGNVLWTASISTSTTVTYFPAPIVISNRGTSSQVGGSSLSTVAYPTSTVNTTSPTTLTITGQKATGSETLILEAYTVEILRV